LVGVFSIVGMGFLLGAGFVHLADKYIPHEHFKRGHEGPSSRLARVWLLVIAITIHNLPEGLAVGVSFGGGHTAIGLSVAVAIGLQNIPEGLAVAAPLVREGYSRKYAATLALATGLVGTDRRFVGNLRCDLRTDSPALWARVRSGCNDIRCRG